MKNVKRLIAGLLAAVMTISSVQMTAYAAEEEVIESETEVVEETDADETVADDDADETVVADEADDVIETQTIAAEVSENTDIDAEETVPVMATIEDTDEEIVTDTETVKTEAVTNEDVETVVPDEETTDQVSDEKTVETEVQELDADVTANTSVDYDAAEKYVHDQLLAKHHQNPNAETITVDVSSYKIPYTTDTDKQKVVEMYTTIKGYSDLYFLKNKLSVTQLQNVLTAITFTIDTEMNDAAFQKAVNEALSNVNDNMNDFQKIVILHDWLALHCKYELSDDVERTAYAAFVTRKTVCQGYALAYKYLLDRVGIENYLIHCEGMNHAWNLVKLDGEYYHVSVSNDSDKDGVNHYLLLVSDKFLHDKCNWNYDWQVTTNWQNSFDIKATSTLYDNASWRKRKTTTIMDDIFDDETEISKTYTITYVLNGGTNNNENPATYTEGTRVEFKDPVKEGYQFDGWYKDPEFTQRVKALSENCAKDYTVYAKWTKLETYTITYVLDGGINSSENPVSYTTGTKVLFKDPVKKGYRFDGWYMDPQLTIEVPYLPVNCKGNVTVYAKWIKTEESNTEESKTEESKTEESKTEESNTEESKTEESNTEESNTEEPKTEESKIEESKTEEPTTEIPKTFKVTFNTNGRGTAPAAYTDIKEGSTITAPAAPEASGYRFDGWYKNAACTKAWDFDNDTVTKDTVLYAKWTYENNTLGAKDIDDMIYTGSACKPEVSVYDEETLLKAGKDYQVKYYNNVNANVGGALKSDTFNVALPYVEITGKGNYTGSVKVNFNILRADINDATLKVTDRFVSSNKAKKPFSSIKMNKAMKQGVDFTLRLTAGDGKELSGAVIPAGMDGVFTLEIIGINNYEGAIERTIYVADKASLPKNEKFAANTVNVSGITDKVYTGKAITQDMTLSYGGRTLVRGTDYTVSYAKNVNKGTASMTFKGLNGFTGSFKKTFKINAADITSAEYDRDVTAVYSKAGVKPELRLTMNGRRLVSGRDYTLSYTDNKAVGNGKVIVKGKGNYAGSFSVPMTIVKADLNDVTVKTTPVAYNAKKAADYAYTPAIKLMDGKSALRAGVDYEIAYQNNTQAAYEECRNGRMSTPCAVITAKEGSPYKLDGQIVIPLPIYQNKLTKNNISVKVEQSECVYTGRQVKPSVEVRYMGILLTEGRDYTVSYGENNVSGRNKGSVTISGTGPNYGGDVTVKFEIYRKQISY